MGGSRDLYGDDDMGGSWDPDRDDERSVVEDVVVGVDVVQVSVRGSTTERKSLLAKIKASLLNWPGFGSRFKEGDLVHLTEAHQGLPAGAPGRVVEAGKYDVKVDVFGAGVYTVPASGLSSLKSRFDIIDSV